MTLVLRKLLASSTFAIAGALETIADRLRKQLRRDQPEGIARRRARPGLRGAGRDSRGVAGRRSQPSRCPPREREAIEAEIADLEEFTRLAVSIDHNAKGDALVKALHVAMQKAKELGCRREGDHLHGVAQDAELPAARAGRHALEGRHRPLQRHEHGRALAAKSTPSG